MTKQQLLALTTLAALPVMTGVVQMNSVNQILWLKPARALHFVQLSHGPQWTYAFGLEGSESAIFGIAAVFECSIFGPWGGIACGLTAVF
jgi:hypothetical protein